MFISLAYLANRGGSAGQVLAAELNRHRPFIYRSITLYLFEYNESNISLAPGSGSRIRYPGEKRATGVSPKAALTSQMICFESQLLQQSAATKRV
jgi:hypothetical protein